MAYDEELVTRIRSLLEGRTGIVEKKMFGGRTFMVNGHMACGVSNDILVVNVRLARIGRTSYTFHFLITNKRDRAVVATGSLTLVWMDDAFNPVRVPEAFRASVRAFEGDRLTE